MQISHRFWTSLDKFEQVLAKTRKLHWTKMAMFFLKVSLDSLAFLLPRSLKRVIRHGSTSEVNANLRFNVEIAISPWHSICRRRTLECRRAVLMSTAAPPLLFLGDEIKNNRRHPLPDQACRNGFENVWDNEQFVWSRVSPASWVPLLLLFLGDKIRNNCRHPLPWCRLFGTCWDNQRLTDGQSYW